MCKLLNVNNTQIDKCTLKISLELSIKNTNKFSLWHRVSSWLWMTAL